jgi:hypothetical protein
MDKQKKPNNLLNQYYIFYHLALYNFNKKVWTNTFHTFYLQQHTYSLAVSNL